MSDTDEQRAEPVAENANVGRSALLPNPRVLLDIFRRRLWLFVLIAGAIGAAAVAYAALAPRTYQATASLQIEPLRGDPVEANRGTVPEQARSADAIDSQILILNSQAIGEQVAQTLRLTSDPQFGGSPSPPSPESDQGRALLSATGQRVRDMVTIRRVGQTALIEVVATARDPRLAARIANGFVDQYLAAVTLQGAQRDERSRTLVDRRLGELQGAAQAADAALQRYKIANGLMSAEGATMAEQETSTLNQQIAQARADLAQKQGRLAAARKQLLAGGGGSDVSSALNSSTIGALRQQEADSSRNLAQLRARYGVKHPAVAQEEQRLADTQRQIQLEIDRIISSLEGEVNVAASGLGSLLGSQAQSRGRLAANTSAQVGYLDLQRKADAAKTVYEAFLNSSRGAEARAGISQPIASLVSAAVPPSTPASPNVTLIVLLGSLFALVGGGAAVAAAEFLDPGIRGRHDVERRLGARYLGAIPELSSTLDGLRNSEAPQDYIVTHPLSSFAESLRSLRAAATLRGNRRPTILVLTSALPLEGKTTTATCLARTLAMSGARTLLLDCDLRRHSASDVLLKGRPGRLSEVLAGTLDYQDALVDDAETGLKVLGVSEAPTDGRDYLAANLVGPLFKRLREDFDYVVVDTAPVLGVADAREVARHGDTVVLLTRWRETSIRSADAAIDLLVDSRADIAGVALTMVDVTRFGSAGGDELYGYHKKFKGYYVN